MEQGEKKFIKDWNKDKTEVHQVYKDWLSLIKNHLLILQEIEH